MHDSDGSRIKKLSAVAYSVMLDVNQGEREDEKFENVYHEEALFSFCSLVFIVPILVPQNILFQNGCKLLACTL